MDSLLTITFLDPNSTPKVSDKIQVNVYNIMQCREYQLSDHEVVETFCQRIVEASKIYRLLNMQLMTIQ